MAQGDLLAKFHPYMNEPPLSDFMSRVDVNAHTLLGADASPPNQSGVFSGVMLPNYSDRGFSVEILFQMITAQTGTIDFSVAFERVGINSQNTTSDGFAAARSVTGVAVPGTAGLVGLATIVFTNAQIDGIGAGDEYRVKVTRTGGNAAGKSGIRKLLIYEA